ncbi:MAG: hypothetical protein K0R89_2944, partial [Ramlibacter sp.]|nr:hypothetical protein [Ramlibacter sp.]
DAKATFAAPRLAEQEKPLMDRMGDWWNSVFTAPAGGDPAAATVAVPETQPPAAATPSASHSQPTAVVMPSTAGPAEVPVAADLPQRPPSFPRALEPTRPVETVPGMQVYRVPEQASAPSATMGAGGFTPQRIEPVARPEPAVRSEPTMPSEPPGRTEAASSESSLPIGEATGSATAAPQ